MNYLVIAVGSAEKGMFMRGQKLIYLRNFRFFRCPRPQREGEGQFEIQEDNFETLG